jgi:hypothetical protein
VTPPAAGAVFDFQNTQPVRNSETASTGGAVDPNLTDEADQFNTVHMSEFGHAVIVDVDNAPPGGNRANPNKDSEVMVDFTDLWSYDGVCRRRKEGASNMAPLMPAGTFDGDLNAEADVFLHFFPTKFLENVIIDQTNRQGGDAFRKHPLSKDEFFVAWLHFHDVPLPMADQR